MEAASCSINQVVSAFGTPRKKGATRGDPLGGKEKDIADSLTSAFWGGGSAQRNEATTAIGIPILSEKCDIDSHFCLTMPPISATE